MVKSVEISEEILQDLFVKVWIKRENLDSEKSFRSYLFKVSENLVYDFFRKAALNKKLESCLVSVAVPTTSPVEQHIYYKEGNLEMQYQNGIRISFTDLNSPGDMLKPGPFVSYTAALTEIKRLLDLGAAQLAAAGTTFAFPMTTGWAGFSTPTTFATFNRGIAAEVARYQSDWNGY
jgi:hypothetical protein